MKQIFTLMLIASFTSAYSQFSMGMHIGASNKNMIAGLQSQYQFRNRFTVGVNMTAHPDNSNPVFFQSRFGYTIGNPEGFSAQPYTGYSYGIQNLEQKNYGGHFTGGVQLRYQLTDIALIYTDINVPSPHYLMFSVGLAGKIPHRDD
ncbi:MAG: hypothetical protein M3O67_05390 [Bacteroidota bacterium]|nr:hypothetical protein [Bacteroidota bacterium]